MSGSYQSSAFSVIGLPTRWTNLIPSALLLLSGRSSGAANDINESGQAVGVCHNFQSGQVTNKRAVLWSGSSVLDLNTVAGPGSVGWVLEEASSINDLGQIVGWGTFNGQTRSFLLTPIPEPGSLIATAVAAVAMVSSCRRVSLVRSRKSSRR